MFANEEFDFDEDFLNDVSQKEIEYYSQTLSSDEESCVRKRFKNDEKGSKPSCSKIILDSDESRNLVSKKDFIIPNSDGKSIRKNLILERLKRHGNNRSEPGVLQQAGKSNGENLNMQKSNFAKEAISHSAVNNESRKNLISERFKRNNAKIPEDDSCKIILNNSKSTDCKTVRQSPLKSAKPLHHKPVTVVRKFPGPAGLLPDVSNGIVTPLITDSMSFDDSNDGTEADLVDNNSIISKYCSQNTTNSFSEGAWQLLMSDLSPDFLSGHEISTIQQKILTNSYKNNKVPFLAGIVQRVDLNVPDPLVVLKDCTGTIEGTICKDILLKYPHSLDIGVVLFLGNVGLLTVGNYLKKCHVIVTLKNILNVYTGKGQIFDVSEMEVRLKTLNNRTQSPNSKIQNRPHANFEHSKNNENTNPQLYQNNLQNCSLKEILPVVKKHVHQEVNKTPVNKGINMLEGSRKNLNSFQADNTNDKPTFESGDIEDFDDEFTASFLDIDDNLVSKAAINCNMETNNSVSMDKDIVTLKKSPNLNKNMFEVTDHLVTKVSENSHNQTVENNSESMEKKASAKEEKSVDRMSDVKLKLAMFKSNTELTPPQSKELDSASTEIFFKNVVESGSVFGFSFNDENDSDEELFSQLDVESIVSRYDKLK